MLDTTHVYMMSQFECIPVSSKDVRNATAKDTVLSRVYDAVMRGWTDVQDKELTPFYNRRTELSVPQGCLTWGIRVIIPQRLRANILEVTRRTFGYLQDEVTGSKLRLVARH